MYWYISVLKKYAVFSGRATREEFWYFQLFNALIAFVLALVDIATGSFNEEVGVGFLSGFYVLGIIIPGLAVQVRRLHDIDFSGWWVLFGLIPLLGPLALFILSVLKSDPEENQYGPPQV